MAGFPKQGKEPKSAMILDCAPVPFPCLRTSCFNKGPGRLKFSGFI